MVKGKIVVSAAVRTPDIQSDTLIFQKMDNGQHNSRITTTGSRSKQICCFSSICFRQRKCI